MRSARFGFGKGTDDDGSVFEFGASWTERRGEDGAQENKAPKTSDENDLSELGVSQEELAQLRRQYAGLKMKKQRASLRQNLLEAWKDKCSAGISSNSTD